MPRTLLPLAIAASIVLNGAAFADEPLQCDASEAKILKQIETRTSFRTIDVPVPALQGPVYIYDGYKNYRKNPKRRFDCVGGYYFPKHRYFSQIKIKETGKVIPCLNKGLIKTFWQIGYIGGNHTWHPRDQMWNLNYYKKDKWVELEPWLHKDGGNLHWRGMGKFTFVDVIPQSKDDQRNLASQLGSNYSKVSFIYDFEMDPVSAHWNEQSEKARKKAEVIYFCDKFTNQIKYHSMKFDVLDAVGLGKSHDLNR